MSEYLDRRSGKKALELQQRENKLQKQRIKKALYNIARKKKLRKKAKAKKEKGEALLE